MITIPADLIVLHNFWTQLHTPATIFIRWPPTFVSAFSFPMSLTIFPLYLSGNNIHHQRSLSIFYLFHENVPLMSVSHIFSSVNSPVHG